jgi:hypothetical protein
MKRFLCREDDIVCLLPIILVFREDSRHLSLGSVNELIVRLMRTGVRDAALVHDREDLQSNMYPVSFRDRDFKKGFKVIFKPHPCFKSAGFMPSGASPSAASAASATIATVAKGLRHS